jgi:2-polyprenyl-3-methyl-5-hydroxy-6-metoxy-1,4-benzoquinol methylase
MTWSEHDPDVFAGTERLFRPVYVNQLPNQFVEAIPGLKQQLEAGIEVADVGCGHGLSTVEMARAFPKSRFHGFDNHAPSIARAQQRAQSVAVSDRAWFEVADADKISGSGYGLIMFCDCLHDMGDPVAACRRAADVLGKNGCVMIIEPMGGNKVEENFNAIGRAFSGASVLCCTPNAVATGKHALGTIAPDAELEKVVKAGGFTTFRRVLQTPFNRVFEARK